MARQPKQKQSLAQTLSGVAGGGQDSFSGTAQALQAFIQSVTSGADNLISTMREQQIRAGEQAQMAAQQTAGAVTDVVSNIASAGQRREEEEKQRAEKFEDREYAEELALWQQELQKESQVWSARLAQRIQEQEDLRLNYVKDMERKVVDYSSFRDAVRSDIDQKMANGYYLQIPNGMEEYQLQMKAIEHSEAFLEDQRGAPYLTWAIQRRNEAVEKIYQQEAGGLGLELTPRKPDLMPLPEPTQRVEGDLPFFDAKTLRDIKRGQGYPEKGIAGMTPDDPMGRHINPYTMKSALWHMQADQQMRTLLTQKGRRVIEENFTKNLLKAEEALKPYTDLHETFAETYEAVAPQAIHEGVMDFIQDPNPQKYGNPSEVITRKIIDRALRTTDGGASKKAYDMLQGNLELQGKDGVQLGLGMYALGQVMAEQITLTLGDPTSQASQALLAELQSRSADPLAQFGRVKGGKGMSAGDQATMLRRELWSTMSQVSNNFKQLEKTAYDQGPVKGLFDELSIVRRAVDSHATVLQSEDEGGADLTPETIQKRLSGLAKQAEPSEAYTRNIGYLEAMAVQFRNQPNPVGAIHNLLSGGKAGVENPNEPVFRAVYENQKQADPVFAQREIIKQQKRVKPSLAKAFGAGLGVIGRGAQSVGSEIAGGVRAGLGAVQEGIGAAASEIGQGIQAGMGSQTQMPQPQQPQAQMRQIPRSQNMQGFLGGQPGTLPPPAQNQQPQSPLQQLGMGG